MTTMTAFLEDKFRDNQVDNKYALHYIRQGITICIVKTDFMDLNVAQKMNSSRQLAQGGKKMPVFTDARMLEKVTSDARVYGASPEVCNTMTAHAILIDGKADAFIINLFLKVLKPSTPTRFFTSEDIAIEWLKTFL